MPYNGGNVGEIQLAPYGENDTPVGIGTTDCVAGVKLHVEGVVSGSNSFLGTGVGNRITNNHVPYLLSGDEAGASLTLQEVTDNGSTTTNSITINRAAQDVAQFNRLTAGTADVTISASNGDSRITFENAASDKFVLGNDSTNNSFRISEGSDLGTNDRFVILNGGNVGIGLTNPQVH